MLIRKKRASPALMDCGGPLKRICPSPRCSPPPTAPPSPLEAPRGAQATSLYWRPLKVRDTPGFLPAGLLQVAGSVHAVRDVSPALAFTASLDHTSTHEDTVSFPLLRPNAYPSLQGDVQSGDPVLVSPLNCSTLLPLSPFLHIWRDLPKVSPWVLRTMQFGYTLQFAPICSEQC